LKFTEATYDIHNTNKESGNCIFKMINMCQQRHSDVTANPDQYKYLVCVHSYRFCIHFTSTAVPSISGMYVNLILQNSGGCRL